MRANHFPRPSRYLVHIKFLSRFWSTFSFFDTFSNIASSYGLNIYICGNTTADGRCVKRNRTPARSLIMIDAQNANQGDSIPIRLDTMSAKLNHIYLAGQRHNNLVNTLMLDAHVAGIIKPVLNIPTSSSNDFWGKTN